MYRDTHRMNVGALCLVWLLAISTPCLADDTVITAGLEGAVAKLMQDWARIQYQQPRESREEAFQALTDDARVLAARYPQAAEPLIWQAVALASYAQTVRGRAGLKAAKQARELLYKAERINPTAMSGAIYITLGRLYFKVPGWPLSFGSKSKSRMYLQKALEIDPSGMEANAFYADLLSSEGDYTQAIRYYRRALEAPARPGQEIADAGRRQQAQNGLRRARQRMASGEIFDAQSF